STPSDAGSIPAISTSAEAASRTGGGLGAFHGDGLGGRLGAAGTGGRPTVVARSAGGEDLPEPGSERLRLPNLPELPTEEPAVVAREDDELLPELCGERLARAPGHRPLALDDIGRASCRDRV